MPNVAVGDAFANTDIHDDLLGKNQFALTGHAQDVDGAAVVNVQLLLSTQDLAAASRRYSSRFRILLYLRAR